MKCRFCSDQLDDVFLDLGSTPPSNAFLTQDALSLPEVCYPLKLYTCRGCFLVQVDEVQSHADLFASDYVYFSSYSSSWLDHAKRYVDQAVDRLELHQNSLVMEIASNDGYLLQFVKARGVQCFGIEPTAGTAKAARERGIETLENFFGGQFAKDLVSARRTADLIIANNVLAHVPNLNDFVSGLKIALAPEGTITVEFPHLMELIANNQFDTVYHEHFSYFSFHTIKRVLGAHGLHAWDVERLPTHGGSLRLWISHAGSGHKVCASVADLLEIETSAGMFGMDYYHGFQACANTVKNELMEFLLRQHRDGSKVVGYGAAAKGVTLLNYAGVKPDLLPFIVDASPHKRGRYLPGSHIPIVDEARLREEQPDFLLILAWNLKKEIMEQLDYVRSWGGRFVTAVPHLDIQ